MPGMPEIMAKGPILKKLDDYFQKLTLGELKEQLETLQRLGPYPEDSIVAFGQGLVVPGSKLEPVLTEGDANHIRNHWFNENGRGWWKEIQPIESIIRQGLISALTVAIYHPETIHYSDERKLQRQLPLPIVFYWQCHTGHSESWATSEPSAYDAVEVSVSWSEHQVTLIIHTPDPPTRDRLTGTEPIFVIKRVNGSHERRCHEEDLVIESDGKYQKSKIIRTRP
jgi:hypothetical protein